MSNLANISVLSADKTAKLKEFGINVDKYGYEGQMTTDNLYNIIPWETYFDEDKCHIIMTSDVSENEIQYIVSYDRVSDGYICQSFVGETFCDALFDAVQYFHYQGQLDSQYYE